MLNRITELKCKVAILSLSFPVIIPEQIIQIVKYNMRCIYTHSINTTLASIKEILFYSIYRDILCYNIKSCNIIIFNMLTIIF